VEKIILCISKPSQHSYSMQHYVGLRFTYFTAFAPYAKNARKSSRV